MESFFGSRWVEVPAGVEELDPASLAPGFRATGVACGIKPSGRLDLGVVACDSPRVRSAALFTRSGAAAAPVVLCRRRCGLDRLAAVVVNAGNANAATGERGLADAGAMRDRAARALGLELEAVGVASTGVIGEPLPMGRITEGIEAAAASLSERGAEDFATSILTTDAGPKRCTVRCGGVTLSAQAKGAGMIQPGFATMLCFVQTDAVVPRPEVALRAAAADSFERITVDGQLSTNDALFLQASGEAGAELPAGLLDAVLLQLALTVVGDGEGASRVGRIEVREAASMAEADRVARAIANSPLVKTALHGRDPNWGRIVQAAGAALQGENIELGPAQVEAGEMGESVPEAELNLRLGRGEHSAQVYFSDLTRAYVELNAEYTT